MNTEKSSASIHAPFPLPISTFWLNSSTAEALKDIIPSSKPKIITILDIQKAVGEQFNVKLEDFKAKKRTKAVAFPRQVAMYLCREMTDYSLPKIGNLFGGRHYTTVMHACDKIQEEMNNNESVAEVVKRLKKDISE